MFERKKYNQSDYLFLTKLFQVSENYNDMIKAINKYIEINPKLTKEKKNYFVSDIQILFPINEIVFKFY